MLKALKFTVCIFLGAVIGMWTGTLNLSAQYNRGYNNGYGQGYYTAFFQYSDGGGVLKMTDVQEEMPKFDPDNRGEMYLPQIAPMFFDADSLK